MTGPHGESGGKVNGVVIRWAGLAITLMGFFGGGVYTWATVRSRVVTNTGIIIDHENRVRALEQKQERILTLVEGLAAKQGIIREKP